MYGLLTSLAFWLYIFNRPSVLSAFLCSILNPKIYFLLFRIRCEKEFSPMNQSSRSSGMHSKSNILIASGVFPFSFCLHRPRHLENRKSSKSFFFGKSKHFFFNKNFTMFLKYLKQWKAMQLSL